MVENNTVTLSGSKLGHRSYLNVMFFKLYVAEDVFCGYSPVRIPYAMAQARPEEKCTYTWGKKEEGKKFQLLPISAHCSNKTHYALTVQIN